ncbi:MAG: hypothetical protein M2R45_02095 [Verrucomicrobia subdivision 3 bacterium]|nr:hypothetical protein [Limisphaerales bacterium]MCS1413846.1 hypothetical protein [Limisphaerales bacterium]
MKKGKAVKYCHTPGCGHAIVNAWSRRQVLGRKDASPLWLSYDGLMHVPLLPL